MSLRRSALVRLLLLGVSADSLPGARRRPQPRPRRQPQAAPADARSCCRPTKSIYDGDNQTVAAVGHVEIVDQGRILLRRHGHL